MPRPFFSVILPVYNGERFIAHAVESVIKQTDEDWELIIVDDCSKDATPEILESFALTDPRIRVFRNSANLRIARSLNRGIEESRGEWIVRLDSDDFYDENYLKILRFSVESVHKDSCCFFSTWVNVVDEEGVRVLDLKLPDAKTIERMMPVENFLYHPATSFSKEAWKNVGGYPTKERLRAEDTAMWLRFFKSRMRLVMIPQPLVNYRIHDKNTTSIQDAKLLREVSSYNVKALRQYWEWRISLHLKQKKLGKAREELKTLCEIQHKMTLKNFQYYLLTFMPESLVHAFMWEIRPRLRFWINQLAGRNVRV